MSNSITKIEVQKKNKERVNIYINDSYSFSCSAELVYNCQLKVGKAAEIKELEKVIEEDNFIGCKNAALRAIERTYKTEKEIADKLLAKEYDEKTIARTLEFLKAYNFVDDNKYAAAYIKEKIRSQGKNKIKFSLIRKGVPEAIIVDRLSEINRDREEDTALVLAEKKYNILVKNEGDYRKIYKKLGDYLIRLGYDSEIVKDILNKVVKEEKNEDKDNTPKFLDEEKLKELAEKRYNIIKKSEKDERKLYKKLGDLLIRKGYSYEQVRPVLREILGNEE